MPCSTSRRSTATTATMRMRCRAVNVEGTRLLLDAVARGADRRRVVHTSSCGTCGPVRGRAATEGDGPPEWELSVPYKRTKVDGERLAMSAAKEGLDVVVVNPTTPVGPGDRRPTPTGKMVADVARGRARAHLAGGALNVVAVEDVGDGTSARPRAGSSRRALPAWRREPLDARGVRHRGERRWAPAAEDGRPVGARQRRGPGRRRRAPGGRAKAVAPRPRRGSACPPADDVRRFQGKAGARTSLPAGGRGAGRRGTGRAGLLERRFLAQFAEWRLAESRPLSYGALSDREREATDQSQVRKPNSTGTNEAYFARGLRAVQANSLPPVVSCCSGEGARSRPGPYLGSAAR